MEAIWADFFRSFLGPDENAIEPLSDWTYPIIDTVDNVRVAGAVDYDPAKHVSVGALTGFIYWRDFVRDILPSGSNGIRIVFANPCSVASFTYQINGPDVVYLGAGDKHEKRYDQHFKKVMLHELSHYTNKSKILYTGAPLDSVYCPLTLHVYPSEEMRAIFTSWNPIILTGAVLAIFSFVSLVFYLYDYKVERRQTTVLNTAVRSTAIVSSLFPSEVRDRLYPATAAADDAKQKSSRRSSSVLPDTAKGKLKSFLRETGVSTNPSLDSSTSVMLEGAPIAELYPDTTVLFADISGFTAWSSERHPAQVRSRFYSKASRECST